MAMQFEIIQASKGLQVVSQHEEYYFLSKNFSHSSVLINHDKKTVGSLKRRSWWRMDFDVYADGKCYQLFQRVLTTKLCCQKTGISFCDLGGGDFFKKNTRVTEIEDNNRRLNLVIYDEEHHLALLLATCLAYNYHINN